MRRITLLIVLALVLTGVAPGFGQQQAAPVGTFYAAWPYPIPPDGHLNTFGAGGPAVGAGIGCTTLGRTAAGLLLAAQADYEPGWPKAGSSKAMKRLSSACARTRPGATARRLPPTIWSAPMPLAAS